MIFGSKKRKEKRKAEAAEKAEGLIFHWWHRQRLVLHIAVFLVMSVVLHVAGFYLFQVVYPPGGKVEPVPDRVTLLNPEDPAVHAVMGKIQDRVVFLRPASENAGVRANLDDYSIQFVPSFTRRKPELKLSFPARELGLTNDPATGKSSPGDQE
ncbi:MAG: hypothetical protein HKN23_07300 [Verrucomicrobiales bacterium]|nr:hypothetical protein [Verrucomicrobiales bacterium]